MAFDQTTRNRLARFVSDARDLLSEEFTRQFQQIYGLDPTSGEISPLERLTALNDAQWETARILRETCSYYLAGIEKVTKRDQRETLERIVREQAFTVLNRLCALRMAEARGLLLQSIAGGYQAQGFQLYIRLASSALGEMGDSYRSYLFSLFDELAFDLPALFDRFSPEGRLFPGENALLKLFDLVNDPEIDPLWVEDETIGWIYQYYNSVEERRQMRAESSAPRNSRELAVRNQFFTPRYVVEFLTDNTLGRIWYEMTRGKTILKDTCCFLVRRPNEIFLDEGEKVPEQNGGEEDLTQEELLHQLFYIPYRPLKDPRELKMLDPACGSMHFGLYAFDLFEKIYAEAWDLEKSLGENELQRLGDFEPLNKIYYDKKSYLRDVPRLIIEHNIHGVDIDSRAVQIAGLSLWLRAQKSWQEQELHPNERPQIRKSNVVCAESMPGDRKMLEEFLSTLHGERLEVLMRKAWHVHSERKVRATPQMAEALAKLVRTVWQEMELAGEAGSLLKIEETLRDAIAIARKESEEKSPLFRVLEYGLNVTPKDQYVQVEAGDKQDFFDRAEVLVFVALRDYAERAENGIGFRRHLFAGDAIQGFDFIDIFRKKYDVVLMNPPFGDPTNQTKTKLNQLYEGFGNDIFTFFLARGALMLCYGGRVGAITNRTGFFTVSQELWRKNLCLNLFRLELMVDLGSGVLDALVETAAYIVANGPSVNIGQFHRATNTKDKEASISRWVKNWLIEKIDDNSYLQYLDDFKFLPSTRIAFWMPRSIMNVFRFNPIYKNTPGEVQVGLQTSDNFRFIRLAWEIQPTEIGNSIECITKKGKTWAFYAKGGEYAPYYADIHLTINWAMNGYEVKNYRDSTGKIISYSRNEHSYFKPGLTYTERTTSNFSIRVMPGGCCFDTKGPRISSNNSQTDLANLTIFMSRPIAYLIEFMVGSAESAARDYTPRAISEIPFPKIDLETKKELSEIAQQIWEYCSNLEAFNETDRNFIMPLLATNLKQGIVEFVQSYEGCHDKEILRILSLTADIEDITNQLFNLKNDAIDAIETDFGKHPMKYPDRDLNDSEVKIVNNKLEVVGNNEALISKTSRAISKQSYYIDRDLELMSHKLKVHPISIMRLRISNRSVNIELIQELVANLLSYFLGVAFGRWDIQYAIGEKKATKITDPFTPLPVCSPGMLQNSIGAPATPHDILSDYPLPISWHGILVDDESNNEDIEKLLHEIMLVLYRNRAEVIEVEACQILDMHSVREYFRKPSGFFTNHLRQYSKSRRQAPIYWPISTPSSSYTLWLYYQRLNDQTLYTCVNDFVNPKYKQISDDVSRLHQKKVRSSSEEQYLERLTDFESELKDFREELLRVAKFWKPNLNDGVQITAAPLWKLFQHRAWQKKLKETWEKLEAGEYDWAHLAYSIWPERVRAKCKSDKSLAIAHDLEVLYVEPAKPLKKKKVIDEETEGWFDDD